MKKRRLAAILFADMVGYTALMSKDEAKGIRRLQRYRSVLEEKVKAYDGEIMQHYGDGSLVVFSSAVNAMFCARELQLALRKKPVVPLRIGLHIGDIAFQEGSIFGDGVNMASRVESLGVAGSVLFTDRFIPDLKNHPDFKAKSLGKFHFKNVEEEQEVFALASRGLVVPRGRLRGKLQAPRVQWDWVKVLGMLAIGIILVYALLQFFNKKNRVLMEDDRVAVWTFQNATADPSYDLVGNMAADWLTQGLMETGLVKVVSANTVRENYQKAGLSAKNPYLDFAEATGATRIIEGNYYLAGDELIFKARFINALTGEVIYPFSASGNKEAPLKGIQDLGQSIMGFLPAEKRVLSLKIKPPKYDAYIQCQRGNELLRIDDEAAVAFYEIAIELDSNYIEPYINLIYAHFLIGNPPIVESLIQKLHKKRHLLNKYESNVLDYWIGFLNGNYRSAFQAVYDNYLMDPQEAVSNARAGRLAYQGLNRPQQALEIFESFDEEEFSKQESYEFKTIGINTGLSLLKLQRYPEVIQQMDKWIALTDVSFLKSIRMMALIRMDSLAAIQETLDGYRRKYAGGFKPGVLFYHMAQEYFLMGREEESRKYARRSLDNLREEGLDVGPHVLGELYSMLSDYTTATRYFDRAVSIAHDSLDIVDNLSRKAVALIKSGDRKTGQKILNSLDDYHFLFEQGCVAYNKTRIYTALGDLESAIRFLKQGKKEGMRHYNRRYERDMDLKPLFNNSDFLEISTQRVY